MEGRTSGAESQRLFVGIPLPAELVDFVRAAQEALPPLPGLRLLRPNQLHLTLAFIGETDAVNAAAAQAVVDSLPDDMGGEGLVTGFLMLPSPTKTRVVALEVADTEGVFGALFERVMGGLEEAAVMRREKRPFRPHLTIARLRAPGPVRPKSDCGMVRFAVESVCLYKSELRREGALYTVLARAVMRRKGRAKA